MQFHQTFLLPKFLTIQYNIMYIYSVYRGPASPKNPVQDCTIFKFGEDCNIITKDYNLA